MSRTERVHDRTDGRMSKSSLKSKGTPARRKAATSEAPNAGDYRTIPALAAYIDRIGAEQRNFRRFVVKREGRDRYHHDAVIIKIVDGAIECGDPEYAPTDQEAAAIKAALTDARMPESITVTKVRVDELRVQIKKDYGANPTLFIFKDASGEGVLFVQQRKFDDAGNKIGDFPWTFWNDGQWRMMEPDGDLPLFGLETLRDAPAVCVHEGAKTAKCVQGMVAGPNRSLAADEVHRRYPWLGECPWMEDLREAAHIGWPGGAPNPHRVDWGPIRRLPPHVPVVIVCDNDASGENAAPEISRRLQRHCTVVRFRGEFPAKFDLADEFPAALWRIKGGSRVYVGPQLRDCQSPATWATRNGGSAKKPHYVLRDEFVNEWHFTITPDAFMHRDRLNRRYTPEEFNTLVAPYADVADVARLLRRKPSAQADELIYNPAQKPGAVALNGRQVINVFQPSPVKPVAPRDDDELRPWLEFTEYLFQDSRDREHVLDWVATLVARPDVRMTHGLLLISETQGVGKTTLAEIAAELVGQTNVVRPRPREVAGEGFTSWLAFKRLAIIAELYDGHTSKTYNRLKTVMTDPVVRVEEKYEKAFELDNKIHLIASSNSRRALKFDHTDRRWFVPLVTEETRDEAAWRDFHAWLKCGGLGLVAHWAAERVSDESHVVSASKPAPPSSAKLSTIRAAMSFGERIVADFGDLIKAREEQTVVRIDRVRACLANRKAAADHTRFGEDGQLFLETAEKIAGVLRGCGLRGIGKQFQDGDNKFSVMANFDIPPEASWSRLKPYCLDPEAAMKTAEADDDPL